MDIATLFNDENKLFLNRLSIFCDSDLERHTVNASPMTTLHISGTSPPTDTFPEMLVDLW